MKDARRFSDSQPWGFETFPKDGRRALAARRKAPASPAMAGWKFWFTVSFEIAKHAGPRNNSIVLATHRGRARRLDAFVSRCSAALTRPRSARDRQRVTGPRVSGRRSGGSAGSGAAFSIAIGAARPIFWRAAVSYSRAASGVVIGIRLAVGLMYWRAPSFQPAQYDSGMAGAAESAGIHAIGVGLPSRSSRAGRQFAPRMHIKAASPWLPQPFPLPVKRRLRHVSLIVRAPA